MKLQKITYVGHSAVFIHTDSLVVGIDPWLEGNPRCPPSLKNPARLDLIVLTHGHSDHAGEAASLAKRLKSAVAATWELAMIMLKEGVQESQVLPMNKGGSIDFKGLKITLTHAFHSSSYDTPSGPIYSGEPCGVVLGDGKQSVYHAGDTCLFSDMALIGEFYHPQVCLLPIGDRFTMNPREAARAAKFVGARTAIPLHYKTFDLLTGTADEFKRECEKFDIEAAILEPGQSHSL